MKVSNCIVSALSLSVIALLPQVVTAATTVDNVRLAQVQGDVMVNNGTRFVKAASGVELKPGAKIVTAKGATVSLVYQKNGCVKQLKPNSMLTVGSADECMAKANNERIYLAEAVGDTVADAANPTETVLGGKSSGAWVNGKWVVISALVVGGAVLATNSGGGGGNNASPQ